MADKFVRLVHPSGDITDVEADHWPDFVRAMHGEVDVVHATLLGGDPYVVRSDSIDSIALLSEGGLQQRRLHNLTFWGNEEDDGRRIS